MEHTLEDLFTNIIRLTSAQRELVYQIALVVAGELDDQELIAHITRAMAHESHLRELECQREADGNSRAAFLPEVPALDVRVDHSFTGLRDIVRGHMKGNDQDTEVQDKGDELLQSIFPGGVRAVTRLPYVDQARVSEDILHKLQNQFAAHVTLLGLDRRVASLADLIAEYSAAVKQSRAYVLATEVQTADARGQLFLLEVICRVLGLTFDSDNPVHLANRTRVLDVLHRQMDQTRSRRAARRRAAADADPETAPDVDADGDAPTPDPDADTGTAAGTDVG